MFEFGCGSIGRNLFTWLISHVPIGATVLELGSGAGTQLLSNFYSMYSVEEDTVWVDRFDSVYIHAPIVDEWYDLDALVDLPKEYDALLVDGPKGTVNRAQFASHLDIFLPDVVFIFDDVHRQLDRQMYRAVCDSLGKSVETYVDSDKAFGVIE